MKELDVLVVIFKKSRLHFLVPFCFYCFCYLYCSCQVGVIAVNGIHVVNGDLKENSLCLSFVLGCCRSFVSHYCYGMVRRPSDENIIPNFKNTCKSANVS